MRNVTVRWTANYHNSYFGIRILRPENEKANATWENVVTTVVMVLFDRPIRGRCVGQLEGFQKAGRLLL